MMLDFPEGPGEAAVDEVGRGCLACEVVAAAVVLPDFSPEEWRQQISSATGEDEETHKRKGKGSGGGLRSVRDSKKMSEKQRAESATFLRTFLEAHRHRGAAYGIGCASPEEIDRINIREATILAMHRALDDLHRMSCSNDVVKKIVVDGNAFRPYHRPPPNHRGGDDDNTDNNKGKEAVPHVCVVKGDATRLNVAAASVLAKVHRDEMVRRYCDEAPELNTRYGFLSNKAYGTVNHIRALREHGATSHHRKTFAPVCSFSASPSPALT